MDLTVAAARDAFLARHGLSRDGYRASWFSVALGPIVFTMPNPGALALHDLHHVALDLAPTFWGEVEVSAFELRTGTPNRLVVVLCVSAVLLGALLSPRRVLRAWRRYHGARGLYARSYDELVALDIEALRRQMGVAPRDGFSGPGA